MNPFLESYLECALWSSTDEQGEPLNASFKVSDFAPEAIASANADCEDFQDAQASCLVEAAISDTRAGFLFWLNRNGHGSGFWDEGREPVFRQLSDACKPYGSSDCYVGDDGRVYLT